MSNRNLISIFASLALGTMAAGTSLSCTQTECGNGTIERGGVVTPAAALTEGSL